MATKATIIIKFGESVDAGSYHAIAELDGTLNLDSEGEEKTGFNPGDDVYFLVQHDSRVRVTAIKPTCGQVDSLGQVTRTRDNIMLYTELNEIQDFGYTGGTANIWRYGNALGLESEGITSFKATLGTFPAIAKVARSCAFNLYRLRASIPALGEDEEYPVAVVVYMEVV